MMRTKKLLMVGGLVAALAIPAGVAVAATDSPPPDAPEMTQPDQPGFGPHGRMMGGNGDPEECPFYDSEAMQEWREQRDERLQEREQWRQQQDGEWQQHRHEREQHRQQMHEHMRSQADETG